MKAMAAMKAMKAMKKKTVSKIAKGRMAKVLVFRGSKEKTVGGMTAASLTKNKNGKIVARKGRRLARRALGLLPSPRQGRHWVSRALSQSRRALLFTRRPRSSTNEHA